jgi:hypothetical protein
MTEHAMISPNDIAAAEYIIDTAGLVSILLDGRKRSNRGRKTDPKPYRLLLLGGLLNVQTRGNFVITDIHRTLVERIPFDEQLRLGIRVPCTDPVTGERLVDVLRLHDLNNALAALRKDLSYGTGSAPDIDDAERTRRNDVIRRFCDALMDVFDFGWTSNTYAMDATGIWSWGRGKAKSDPPAAGDAEADDGAINGAHGGATAA